MPRSLADGHKKIAILTEKPANPAAPTLTELNAGIDAACRILASDWSFSATDSDKINERAVCDENNSNAIGASNYQAGATIFREFDETTKAPDPVEDALFAAAWVKGTQLWIYERHTAKKSTEAWAADDEIRLGAEVLTDEPQAPGEGGYIKARVPMEVQKGYPYIQVAAGA